MRTASLHREAEWRRVRFHAMTMTAMTMPRHMSGQILKDGIKKVNINENDELNYSHRGINAKETKRNGYETHHETTLLRREL